MPQGFVSLPCARRDRRVERHARNTEASEELRVDVVELELRDHEALRAGLANNASISAT